MTVTVDGFKAQSDQKAIRYDRKGEFGDSQPATWDDEASEPEVETESCDD